MRWIIIIINLIFILILRDRLIKQIALPTHEEQESLARPAQAYKVTRALELDSTEWKHRQHVLLTPSRMTQRNRAPFPPALPFARSKSPQFHDVAI